MQMKPLLNSKKIRVFVSCFKIISHTTDLINKVLGNQTCDKALCENKESYQKFSLHEAIEGTEL